jgi:hypothetical protein
MGWYGLAWAGIGRLFRTTTTHTYAEINSIDYCQTYADLCTHYTCDLTLFICLLQAPSSMT